MTIRRGGDWGRPGSIPDGLVWCDDDRTVAEAFADGVREIGVRGGDMARTLGLDGARESAVAFDIDMISVTLDDVSTWALAHVVVRHRRWSWWRGASVAVMNAQFIGEWDVAPRGHPNDGRLDVLEVDASMGVRQRLLARRRLPSGTHVPHPLVRLRSSTSFEFGIHSSAQVLIDGVPWGSPASSCVVENVPDALVVWIPSGGVR